MPLGFIFVLVQKKSLKITLDGLPKSYNKSHKNIIYFTSDGRFNKTGTEPVLN